MTKKELIRIQDCIESEGFCYTFFHYSSFEEIKDKQLHERINAFKEAASALAKYVDAEMD